jgi:hypothetical protein
MSDVRNLTLRFLECAGIESETDVLDVAETIADLGLRPGVGAYTATGQPAPVEDVRSFVRTQHRPVPGGERPDRHYMFESWVYGGVWMPARGVRTAITIARRGGAWDWDVTVTIRTWSHSHAGMPLEALVQGATDLLEQIGIALYPRARPAIGLLYGVGNDDIDMPPVVLRRKLIAGWRTWYGPAYVDTFGRDVLLGLPDRTEPLGDGGVYQALDVDPLDLVAGKRSVYAGVVSYLEERGIRPAWPRMPRPKSDQAAPRRRRAEQEVMENRKLDELQEYVREMLSNAIVMESGLRVLMLPLQEPWSELSAAEKDLIYQHVAYIAQEIMTEHPQGRVRIEFDEVPADLRAMLDAAFPPGGPVSFGLLTDDPPAE